MRWTVVCTAGSRPDAEVIGAVLRGHGIDVLVTGDDAGTMDPALAFANGIEVRVPESDAARARALIEQPSHPRRPRRPG